MFEQTDHELAPWHVVSGEQKRWARVEVIETLIKRIEHGMDGYKKPIPDDDSFI